MFNLFKSRTQNKRNEDREMKIKKALSEKFFNYEDSIKEPEENIVDITNYTFVTIRGKRIRTKLEHITIMDIPSYPHKCA